MNLNNRIHKAALDLEQELTLLNIDNLNISDYSKRYFKDYLRKLNYSLKACSFIIFKSLNIAGTKPEDTVFVDYGGGVGILSLLAKKAGIETVIYNDIYDIACEDAAVISKALGIQVDHFVTGDVRDLKDYTEKENLSIDIIASRNVIEHIYDLEEYFNILSSFKSPSLTLFFATTANEKNILVDLYTKNIQKKIEHQGLKGKWEKERDNIKPYRLLREEIIKKNFPYLSEEEIKTLTTRTRGLNESVIRKVLQKYIETKELPSYPSHPTNTCDPYTGNWAEHLVSLKDYERLFVQNGFTFDFENGFYNTNYEIKALNLITPLINRVIKLVGKKGIYLAPFIALKGKKSTIE